MLNNMESGAAKSLYLMWPEAMIEQTGIFAEATAMLAKGQRLKYGLRESILSIALPTKLTTSPAQDLKHRYYGVSAEDKEAVRVNEPGRAIWAKISADF